MMTETVVVEKPAAKKKVTPKKFINRPPIDPSAVYSRREAAYAVGASVQTMIRAWVSGHLKGYTSGNRIKHAGQHLLDWLAAGGKTA